MRLSEWREGLSEEETRRNNNFVGVGGGGGATDWRERVARAKARRGKDA